MVKNPINTRKLEAIAREYIMTNNAIPGGKTGYGHAIGSRVETFAHDLLQKCLPGVNDQISVHWPHEFLNKLLGKHQMMGLDHAGIISRTWWGKLLLQKSPKFETYKQTQGLGADLISHYGDGFDDLDGVILLNVKSRNLDRKGRHPNIISAYRLLDYFSSIGNEKPAGDSLDKVQYWVMGFDHKSGLIQNVHVKDLFKLDVSKMPAINFDAALQLQWHVSEMETLPNQTNREFVSNFTEKFNADWIEHKEHRDRRVLSKTKAIQKSLWLDRV